MIKIRFVCLLLLLSLHKVSVVALCIRELLKGPLYYVLSITSACIYYWKSSPIAIAVICNLCAGDGKYS